MRSLQGMTEEEAAQLQPAVTVSLLDFPVDQLICIGSPNGLFLALRKARCCFGSMCDISENPVSVTHFN